LLRRAHERPAGDGVDRAEVARAARSAALHAARVLGLHLRATRPAREPTLARHQSPSPGRPRQVGYTITDLGGKPRRARAWSSKKPPIPLAPRPSRMAARLRRSPKWPASRWR